MQSLWVTRLAWDVCRFERERVRLGCPFPASNFAPRCLLPDLREHVGNPTILVQAQQLPRLYSAFSLGLPLTAARSRSQQQQSSEGAGHLCLRQRGDPAGLLLLQPSAGTTAKATHREHFARKPARGSWSRMGRGRAGRRRAGAGEMAAGLAACSLVGKTGA